MPKNRLRMAGIGVVLIFVGLLIFGGGIGTVVAMDDVSGDDHKTNSSVQMDPSSESAETLSTHSETEHLEVAVNTVPQGASFSPNDKMKIFAGIVNTSGPVTGVASEDLVITVKEPDGSTKSFEATTDYNGSAQITYDLAESNFDAGTYMITVKQKDGDLTVTDQAYVGPVIEEMNNRDGNIFPGEEKEFSFLVRSGENGVEGESVNIVLKDSEGTTIQEVQDVTDKDGFVSTKIQLTDTGSYYLTATLDGNTQNSDRVEATKSIEVVDMAVVSDWDLEQGVTGEKTVYGGYVRDKDGQVANTDFTVRVVNKTNWNQPTEVVSKTVQTDDNGFFLIKYEVPANADRLYAQVETPQGNLVDEEYLSIDELDSETEVTFNANFDDYQVMPGSEATVNIEALENGQPLVDQEVSVLIGLGYQGPPIEMKTVTTDQEGTASTTVSIPEGIDGATIRGEAYIPNDNGYLDSSLYASVEKYDIDLDVEQGEVGEDLNVSVQAESQDEEPIEGIPLQFAGLYTGHTSGTYTTGEMVTESDGADKTTISVPRDLGPDNGINYVDRYTPVTTNRIGLFEFPGSLTLETSEESDWGQPIAKPGEEVGIVFSTPNGTEATGLAFGYVEYGDYNADGGIATQIGGGSEGRLTIPEYAADEEYVGITVWAADNDGNFYKDQDWIKINASSEVEENPLNVTLSDSTVTTDGSTEVGVSVEDGMTGDPVEGATVEIAGLNLVETTDSSGTATLNLTGISPGEYTVSASADGFVDGMSTVTIQSDAATVHVEPAEQTGAVGGSTQFDIVVEGYDAGIASYEFDASLTGGNVAQFTDVSLRGTSSGDTLTTVNYSDNKTKISVAAGVAGHEEGTVATLTVEGVKNGSAELLLSNLALGDSNGDAYSIGEVTKGTIDITQVPSVVGDAPVQDLNGDGTSEDVNGDGEFDIVDVNAFFQNYQSDTVQAHPSHFDYNGDGEINIVDVNRLFQNALA